MESIIYIHVIIMGLWDWHTKKPYFHINFVDFFEAVNWHTKNKKRLNRVLYTQI